MRADGPRPAAGVHSAYGVQRADPRAHRACTDDRTLPYFAVADIAEALARIQALGSEVIHPGEPVGDLPGFRGEALSAPPGARMTSRCSETTIVGEGEAIGGAVGVWPNLNSPGGTPASMKHVGTPWPAKSLSGVVRVQAIAGAPDPVAELFPASVVPGRLAPASTQPSRRIRSEPQRAAITPLPRQQCEYALRAWRRATPPLAALTSEGPRRRRLPTGEAVRDSRLASDLLRPLRHGGLARGSIVVVCPDGLDFGDPDFLATQMARLRRLAHHVVWLNPPKEYPAHEPLATGMGAAFPQVDISARARDLASLEALGAELARI